MAYVVSGSLTTSSWLANNGGTRSYSLNWWANQDVSTNKSTITWEIRSSGTYGYQVAERTVSAVIAGTQVFYKTDRVMRDPNTVIATGTIVLDHNTDGNRSFSASLQVAVYTSSINCTGSSSWDLQTIPRRATVTAAPNFNDEQNPTINYSNLAGNAVTSLQACISLTGQTDDIKYRDISKTGTSYTFSLTEDERNLLRNATVGSNSRTVYFYVKTVIGSNTFYHNMSKTFSIINGVPTLTGDVQDINDATYALTGNRNILVRHYSKAQATGTYELKKNATLNSYYVLNNTARQTTNPAIFDEVTSGSFTFSLTDSRGNVVNKTVTKQMVEYVKLTCNAEQGVPSTDGTFRFAASGNCYNGSFGAVTNTLTVQYRYKTSNGSYTNWANMTVERDGNTYSAYVNLTGLDYRETYTFQAKATDKLTTASTAERPVKATPVFSWNDEVFEFNVPVVFNDGATGVTGGESGGSVGNTVEGDVNITGNLRLKGSGNYGNTLYFGDGSYCYIQEPSDDTMTLKASRINLEASGAYLNGEPIQSMASGVWSPLLSSPNAVSSYTVQHGWYSKLGQVVTLGFQIKATINAGYSSTALTIEGCPFTPMFMASGGGIAHNIYVSSGLVFEGWVINDSGVISARLQPANGTSAGNLNISSTSSYPTGSGTVVTLAGTICFMANS